MTYISKGEQFWNEDHTEGYEITRDIHEGDLIVAEQFKPLGESCKPMFGLPYWFWYGVEAYRSKAKEHNNIKGS